MSELTRKVTAQARLTYRGLSIEDATKLVDYWNKNYDEEKFYKEEIYPRGISVKFITEEDGDEYETWPTGTYCVEFRSYVYKASCTDDLTKVSEWATEDSERLEKLRALIKKDLNID